MDCLTYGQSSPSDGTLGLTVAAGSTPLPSECTGTTCDVASTPARTSLPSLWRAQVPRASSYSLPPPLQLLASGKFATTYLSGSLRISRAVPPLPSAPAELRVFVREGGGDEGATWQEEEDARTAAAEEEAAAAAAAGADAVEAEGGEGGAVEEQEDGLYFDEVPD